MLGKEVHIGLEKSLKNNPCGDTGVLAVFQVIHTKGPRRGRYSQRHIGWSSELVSALQRCRLHTRSAQALYL